MWFTILGSIAAALVNGLLRIFFPAHPTITPEVVAQAQRDRADILQSQKAARDEADKIRSKVGTSLNSPPVVGGGTGVFTHDGNERPDHGGSGDNPNSGSRL